MRLVQKSLLHKGYIVLKNGELIPLWELESIKSENGQILFNGLSTIEETEVCGIYGTNEKQLPKILEKINSFKKEHAIIPQDLTEELRIGFSYNRANSLTKSRSKVTFYK